MKKVYYNKDGDEITFDEELSDLCLKNNNEFELFRATLSLKGYLK